MQISQACLCPKRHTPKNVIQPLSIPPYSLPFIHVHKTLEHSLWIRFCTETPQSEFKTRTRLIRSFLAYLSSPEQPINSRNSISAAILSSRAVISSYCHFKSGCLAVTRSLNVSLRKKQRGGKEKGRQQRMKLALVKTGSAVTMYH